MDHTTGAVLGQLAVAAKSNEIPAVRTLLATFDLSGVVVTVDAMHTQTDTATAIVDAGGDYVFTVKGNQPSLYTGALTPQRGTPGAGPSSMIWRGSATTAWTWAAWLAARRVRSARETVEATSSMWFGRQT